MPALELGRDAFAGGDWRNAFEQLIAANHERPLEPEDLQILAEAAYLLGREDECADAWTRAYHGFLGRGEMVSATRCAFWFAWGLWYKGQYTQSSAWFGRAQRLVDGHHLDCAERGLLLLPRAVELVATNPAASLEMLIDLAKMAETFGDPNLLAFSRLGQGESLISLGRIRDGVPLLDEVVVAATSGELNAMTTGTVYCAVLLQWQEIFDLHRAREWTAALNHWCEVHPDLVPFRGQCLVHRSEVALMEGDWPRALEQVQYARDLLERPPPQPAASLACYQQAELHRLRGKVQAAEAMYRQAAERGHDPQPGLAQLRLAQGQADGATAMIRRALDEAQHASARARLLPAFVDIMLAANDREAARAAAQELSDIATDRDAPLLRGLAGASWGAVHLAENRARDALGALRSAFAIWRDLDVPHEAARVRVLIGLACRALGDDESADMELEAARSSFAQLGAAPDLARAESLLRGASEDSPGGLTARELQVLRLVAAGMTNRAIGDELVISERTVARHVSNILTKLSLPSRAAATAYAYEHRLT